MSTPLPDNARCLHCNYLLRGLPENKCPECGHPFDPANPATMRFIGLTTFWRQWAAAPSPIEVVLAAGSAIVAIAVAARPSNYFFVRGFTPQPLDNLLAFWFTCVGCLLTLLYALRIVASLRWLCVPAEFREPPDARRSRRRWVALPLALSVIVSLTLYAWPLAIRFHWSRAALDAEVQRILAIRAKDPSKPVFSEINHRIGLFSVRVASIRPGDRWLSIDTDGQCVGGLQFDVTSPQWHAWPELAPDWRPYTNTD